MDNSPCQNKTARGDDSVTLSSLEREPEIAVNQGSLTYTTATTSLVDGISCMASYLYAGSRHPRDHGRGTSSERSQEISSILTIKTELAAYGSIVVDAETLPVVGHPDCKIGNEDQVTEDDDDNDDNVSQAKLRGHLLSKRNEFDVPVSKEKGYRATALRICSFQRPHMRAFHGSWMCFCCAWLLWFSMAPLMTTISVTSVPMTKGQIWASNMCALVGTFFVRIAVGPMCDEHGGKDILTGLLAVCAIPCLLAGVLIQNYASLLVVRFLIGCVGGTLVPAQFWVASHFAPECAGVAMATAAGWGALGGGLAQVLMGSVLFPTLRHLLDGNDDLAWRVALTVPACLALATAYFIYHNADDSPLGSYKEVRQAGLSKQKSAMDSFRQGVYNLNAWLLLVQFGACHGIELAMESGMAVHLSERFDISAEAAAGWASLYGLMNLFARGFGGYMSDRLHKLFSLQGRLYLQMTLLMLEGLGIFGFIQSENSQTVALCVMVAFAAMGQMAMGSTFGIIPYVDPRCTGTITGLVGAGGNLGGVLLSNVFRTSNSDKESFLIMATYCAVAAILTPLSLLLGIEVLFREERPNHRL